MTEELLTTKQAAELLGVGPTSIKRWADSGLIRCVKTPGGHRRIPRAEIEAMVSAGSPPVVSSETGFDAWIDALLDADSSRIDSMLAMERGTLGSWLHVAETLGPVLGEIGERWNDGKISVVEEHLLSERLARALARVSDGLESPRMAPTALLVTAQGDQHTLGLSLVELCLRSLGWGCRWFGRNAPFHSVRSFVDDHGADLIAVSASIHSTSARMLADETLRYEEMCEAHGCKLILGGQGRWPESPRYAKRISRFSELAALS